MMNDKWDRWPEIFYRELPDDAADGSISYSEAVDGEEAYIKRWDADQQEWVDVSKLGLLFYKSATDDPEAYQPSFGWVRFHIDIPDGSSVTLSRCRYSNGYQADINDCPLIWPDRIAATIEKQQGSSTAVAWISNFEAMLQYCSFWMEYKTGFNESYSENSYWMASFWIERTVPDMDFILECNNRIWGCRYGKNKFGELVNEIYAAKQGDFCDWNAFVGISTDSYVASCGAPGLFTGAVNFNGRPLFFKENHYYLVSGDYPSEYGYSEGPIKGVQNGSGKSLVVIDRVAYYKGVDGVYAFDGYSATCISAALGEVAYKNARAGAYRDKYYISMQDANDAWHLFVYDTKKGLWHKEDDLRVDYFFNHNSNLFYLVDGMIYCIDAETQPVYGVPEEEIEPPVEWMAETGNLTTGIPYKKYLSKLNVRMKVHKGASVRIFIQYDESGKWEELFYMTATAQRSFTIPIRPKRCDHIKLKLTGVGDVEVYSIIKTLEKGSDL